MNPPQERKLDPKPDSEKPFQNFFEILVEKLGLDEEGLKSIKIPDKDEPMELQFKETDKTIEYNL